MGRPEYRKYLGPWAFGKPVLKIPVPVLGFFFLETRLVPRAFAVSEGSTGL